MQSSKVVDFSSPEFRRLTEDILATKGDALRSSFVLHQNIRAFTPEGIALFTVLFHVRLDVFLRKSRSEQDRSRTEGASIRDRFESMDPSTRQKVIFYSGYSPAELMMLFMGLFPEDAPYNFARRLEILFLMLQKENNIVLEKGV